MLRRRLLVVAAAAFAVVATSVAAQAECMRDEGRAGGRCEATQRTYKVAVKHKAPAQRPVAVASVAPSERTFAGNDLVAEARRYIGTNPTSRRSLWCGAFMDMVLQRTGHRPGGNLASAYASYGRRVAGPQIGALAVMSRGKGGGHVGVVSGVDAAGNVIVVSGNHNNTVAESVYPRSRIYAYVMPSG